MPSKSNNTYYNNTNLDDIKMLLSYLSCGRPSSNSYKKEKYKQELKRAKIRVWLDCDNTLFTWAMTPEDLALCEQHPALERITPEFPAKDIFLIYKQQTKKLLVSLRQLPDVELGIITLASYTKKYVINLLTTGLELPENFFANMHFVNRYKYGSIPKGLIINKMVKHQKFGSQDIHVLLDDLHVNVESAVQYGFFAIRAQAWDIEVIERENDRDILRYIGSADYLNDLEQLVRIKAEELAQNKRTIDDDFIVVKNALQIDPPAIQTVRPYLDM